MICTVLILALNLREPKIYHYFGVFYKNYKKVDPLPRLKTMPFLPGLHLLTRWQAGDQSAKEAMIRIFDVPIAGGFDENFAILAPHDRVNSTASVHMLSLAVFHVLYGIESWE